MVTGMPRIGEGGEQAADLAGGEPDQGIAVVIMLPGVSGKVVHRCWCPLSLSGGDLKECQGEPGHYAFLVDDDVPSLVPGLSARA